MHKKVPYRMIPVQAVNLTSVGYQTEDKILYVEFRTGLAYKYENVPKRLYLGLLSAESADEFFGDHIRSKFPRTRLDYFL